MARARSWFRGRQSGESRKTAAPSSGNTSTVAVVTTGVTVVRGYFAPELKDPTSARPAPAMRRIGMSKQCLVCMLQQRNVMQRTDKLLMKIYIGKLWLFGGYRPFCWKG
jgi:hypothetical protein